MGQRLQLQSSSSQAFHFTFTELHFQVLGPPFHLYSRPETPGTRARLPGPTGSPVVAIPIVRQTLQVPGLSFHFYSSPEAPGRRLTDQPNCSLTVDQITSLRSETSQFHLYSSSSLTAAACSRREPGPKPHHLTDRADPLASIGEKAPPTLRTPDPYRFTYTVSHSELAKSTGLCLAFRLG